MKNMRKTPNIEITSVLLELFVYSIDNSRNVNKPKESDMKRNCKIPPRFKIKVKIAHFQDRNLNEASPLS